MTPTVSAHDLLAITDCARANCVDPATHNGYCDRHAREERILAMPSLEDLIDQQINLGHKDPHAFPDLLKKSLGEDLLAIVMPYIDDFIAEMSRRRITEIRRRSVARINPAGLGDPEILIRSMWVPTGDGKIVYKPIGEMTAEDFDSRAVYLEHMAHGIRTSAQWCRDVAEHMRAEGAKTAKRLSALPPLPEIE